jgi:hypothetical protein
MSIGQFAAAIVTGLLSVLLPLLLFIAAVAALVYMARWWIDRSKTGR